MTNAVVLAGRPNRGALSEEKAEYEALIDVAGKPMLVWVLEALTRAEQVDLVAVVAPREVHDALDVEGVLWVEAGESLTENVRRGAAALPRDQSILMVSGDIPLLRSEMVDEFVQRAESCGGDIVYPIIERKICEQKYPLVRRTYVSLKEGTFTGGNMVFLRAGALAPALQLLQKAYKARKKPWRLATMLGLRFVFQLFTHSAHLEQVERKASQLLGVQARAIRVHAPEIGIDVDKPDDLKLVRSALQ